MDAVAVVAKAADTNLTQTQQQITAIHLHAFFGSPVIIPESRQCLLENTQAYHYYIWVLSAYPDPKKEPSHAISGTLMLQKFCSLK